MLAHRMTGESAARKAKKAAKCRRSDSIMPPTYSALPAGNDINKVIVNISGDEQCNQLNGSTFKDKGVHHRRAHQETTE